MSDITATTVRSKLTVGLDVGDRYTQVCVLDEDGEIVEEARVTNYAQSLPAALRGHATRLTGT